MAALSADRNTPRAEGDIRQGGLAATVLVYAGAIVMRNASGFLTKGQAATGLVGVGRAEERKTGGASAGDEPLKYRPGTYRFGNSASSDAITIAEIGDVCFVVDDQTVAKTDGGGTRSAAGFIDSVDAQGVWVRFDEAMLVSHLAGLASPA
ncbi:hypothetical protein SAMN02983003_3167 [Devosia enhydra]|uniref:Bacteriophage lambda head decoration protein D n=1 Tax=Devosia enhydra TaxID=665118 RepID=A0A1K2I1A0_9HYPH|nr:hypothetical protein [Devosia enhydra]SFZ85995.1 hypothetical protein SAMN02983003_3167 [Devosia enhydra]